MTRNDPQLSLAVNSWINGGRIVWPGADLRYSNLFGTSLRYANLRNADLTGADLSYADLHGASLTEADLTGARIRLGNRTFTLTEEIER
jgi:uncharacterized protein YjbI with pentapeptide repeats